MGTQIDLSPNGYHLNLTGSPVVVPGRFANRNAYYVTGGVYVAKSMSFLTGDYFSLLFWLYPTTVTQTCGLFQWAAAEASGVPFVLFQQNGTNAYRWLTGDTYRSNFYLQPNVWNCIVLTRDTGAHYLYVNGVLIMTWSATMTNHNNAQNVYYGNGYGGTPTMTFANCAVWTRTLDSREIDSYYQIATGNAIKSRSWSMDSASSSPQTISGLSGITSAEAFGTAKANFSFATSGIASTEGFGSGKTILILTSSGIATAEAFGSGLIKLKALPPGIVSDEAFGSAFLNVKQTVNLFSGIGSAETFGSAIISIDQLLQLTGIASAEAFGNDTLFTGVFLLPDSIQTTEAFGNETIRMHVNPSGITSSEGFGTPVFTVARILQMFGITSSETFGNLSIDQILKLLGLTSAESFGGCVLINSIFSRGNYSALPGNDADLENVYTAAERGYVLSEDDVYTEQSAVSEYIVHQFKDYVGVNNLATLRLEAKSSLAPLISPVTLQIYNRSTALWETIAINNTADADDKFTLYAYVGDLTNYKDGNNVISNRVCQLAL
jgi:hypothetical protein